jgi:peroxiredoxin
MVRNILIAAILLIGIQSSCSSSVKKEEKIKSVPANKESDQKQNVTVLPNMMVTGIDAKPFNTQSLKGKKTILILFQPDCEHCQSEARQIAERLMKFKGYNLYFISSAALKDIQKFSIDYKLSGYPNIHFARTEVQSIIDSFGPIPAPSLFIYSEKGELANKFEGEMEIDVVTKYL